MSETPEETLAEFIAFSTFKGLGPPETVAAREALASLRQRQEELQAENDALGEQYAGASADYETLAASLRTQLQQAETALREIEAYPASHDEGRAMRTIAQAALAAPPPNPPTSSQEKP